MRPAALRVAIALLALWGIGVGASTLMAADTRHGGSRAALSERDIARLLVDDGGIVLDAEGRPVVGRDGKPLRVDEKGRVVDSRGRAVRDKRGRPLRVRGKRSLRAQVRTDGRPRRNRPRKRRGPDRPGSKPGARPVKTPGATPAPGSARPIVIGAAYQDHEAHNRLAAQLGGKQRAADPLPQLEATVDHINATGGIDGRRVELRPLKYDFTLGRPTDHTINETCAFFKEGANPVAVIHTGVRPWVLGPCLEQAGIPLVTHFAGTMPRSFVAQHGGPYSPGSLGLDRFADVYVSGLQRDGFINRRSRVGLLWYGGPGYDESAALVQRNLRDAQIPLVAQKRIDPANSSEEMGSYLASFSRAVVDFRSKKVDRVLTIDNFGTILGFFAKNCKNQDCGWRYGVSSLNSPNFLAINAEPDEIAGAVGVGWAPLLDLAEDAGQTPGTRGTCAQIMRARGIDVGDRTPYGEYNAMGYCDDLLAIRAALTGREASGAGLRAGLQTLGSAFASGLTLRTALGPQRHDGADAFRLMRYDRNCRCFQYTGEPFSG